ncbi:unnamed protein product [Dracunculus medinensis]|uniref:RRM domain-containing protein n=1 Tax=Dracunculus medinensis TaxID=318479 RepID=A0A0N4UF15_DRAME|nr:unnamed protein product [Dracunculus medinensis]
MSSVRCDLCNVHLSSHAVLDAHNSGKKHRKKVQDTEHFSALTSRSVYVSGLPLNTFTSIKQVRELFSRYGEVERIFLDLTKGSFAIIDFLDELAAEKALDDQKILVGEHVASIRRRQVSFIKTKQKLEKIDKKRIIKQLSMVSGSFNDQINELIRLYYIGDDQLAERLSFADLLSTALNNYFCSGVKVILFGSSITKIGTVDSDIDASLFFDQPLSIHGIRSVYERDKFALMTCEPSVFRIRKICASEFGRLATADRVRVLAKILNDIRREGLAQVSDQHLVLGARCPIVRFFFNKQENFRRFIDMIASDSSSTIRHFLAIVKFWALLNDFTRQEEYRQYNLEKVTIEDWPIDYTIHPVNLSYISINTLIKSRTVKYFIIHIFYLPIHKLQDFFTWFVHLQFRDIVLCPRLGLSLNREKFQNLFHQNTIQEFKFGVLNIQDPLELSHNISQFVSTHYISMMRREMMYALARIKLHPDSLVALLSSDIMSQNSHTSNLRFFLKFLMFQRIGDSFFLILFPSSTLFPLRNLKMANYFGYFNLIFCLFYWHFET